MVTLRPYQEAAKKAVFREWDEGRKKTLLVLPTGTGKTIVFASVIDAAVQNGGRALVLAHRGELLTQAADKLYAAYGLSAALEKADQSSIGSFLPVTVGSVQSLCRKERLDKFPKDYFTTVVVDEAHHATSDSYQTVLTHFDTANILGVTATPDRADQRSLAGFFDSKAFEYTMGEAVKDGYLSPIKAHMLPLSIDLSSAKIQNGDYAAGDLGNAIEPYLEAIADEMATRCMDRKTVVFLPLISTAQKFCAKLQNRGFRAAEVNGESTDRAEILSDFESGKYNVLCNAMLLTEGWDCPSVDCVVVLRPTKVRSLYQQMVGRGMRLSPGKDHLLLLDFLWLTNRHDLCRPSALVAPAREIAQKIDEMTKEGTVDLQAAEEEAARQAAADLEASLQKELAEMQHKKAKLVDPLQYALSIAAEDLADYVPSFAWELSPPTEKQLAFLEKRGISPFGIENSGKATLLIDKLIRRQQEGLATPKQIRCLERFGFLHVGTWSFEAANKMISRLAANKWFVPRGIVASAYVPDHA